MAQVRQTKTRTKVKYHPFKWVPEQKHALKLLEQKCFEVPVLEFASYSKAFILHTDASGVVFDVVLSQVQRGVERVITYANRGIFKAERNYLIHKLEFLALKWAVTEKLHDCLLGNIFSVITQLVPGVSSVIHTQWVISDWTEPWNYSLSNTVGMHQSFCDCITRCDRCVRRKDWNPQRALLVHTKTCPPVELFCMDFSKLGQSKGGTENILVVTNHFIKYAQIYPTHNQSMKTITKTFFNNFFVHYSFPRRLHSGQGQNFEIILTTELCQFANIKNNHTSLYYSIYGKWDCRKV